MEATLNELIKKGCEIKNDMIFIKSPHQSLLSLPSDDYKFKDVQEFEIWRNKCVRFLSVNFKNDICVDAFRKVIEHMDFRIAPEYMDEFIGILESCKSYPDIIEKNDKKHDTSMPINISVNQSQSQSQSQQIAVSIFLDAIKDELTGKQLKELQSICKEEKNPQKAKSRIIEKIKSFGEDVLSNIIANIIMNPSILEFFYLETII